MAGSLNSHLDEEPQFKMDVDMLRCQSCFTVVSNVVQTGCGHKYCENCLSSHLPDDGSAVKCPADEDYCETISKDQTVIGTRVNVLSLPVYCLFSSYGCVANITWGTYMEHIQACSYKRIKCPHRINGCLELLKEHQMEIHLKKCRFKPSTCQYCNQGSTHNMGCPLAVIPCSFQQFGCGFTGTTAALEEHMKIDIAQHLEMLSEFVVKLKVQLQTVLDGKVNDLVNENNVLKYKLAELQASICDKDVYAHKLHMLAFENKIIEDRLQMAAVEEHEQRLRKISSCPQVYTVLEGQYSEHKPINEKLLKKIAVKISTDQEMMDLGIHLDIPIAAIKAIRTDNITSINQAALSMLYHWFKYVEETSEDALSKLRSALFEVGLSKSAEELNL